MQSRILSVEKQKDTKTGKCALSIVVPVYNEAQCLPILRERLGKVLEEAKTDSEVILVDDVVTTGATINECARVLKEHGASEVYSCVAAITPDQNC